MTNKLDKMLNAPPKKRKKSFKFHYKDLETKCPILALAMPAVYWWNEHRSKQWNALKWDEARTIAILQFVFPKIAEANREERSFWVSLHKRCRTRIQTACRKRDTMYSEKFRKEIVRYLEQSFTIEGYTKLNESDDDWVELTFIKK